MYPLMTKVKKRQGLLEEGWEQQGMSLTSATHPCWKGQSSHLIISQMRWILIGFQLISIGDSMKGTMDNCKVSTRRRPPSNGVKSKCLSGGVVTTIHHQWWSGTTRGTRGSIQNIPPSPQVFCLKANLWRWRSSAWYPTGKTPYALLSWTIRKFSSSHTRTCWEE